MPTLSNHNDGRWSYLEETSETVSQLKNLCHPHDRLREEGYVVEALTRAQILSKLRCENCTRSIPNPIVVDGRILAFGTPKKVSPCTFHPRGVVRGAFTCCGTRIFTKGDSGCYEAPSHQLPHDFETFLTQHWQYYKVLAPHPPSISASGSAELGTTDIRPAIALDCEFGTNKYGESELIRISAVDFFSRGLLLDTLVCPDIRMLHYNTKYSGVRKVDMDSARRSRTALAGRDAAREALFEFVGPDTVIVVHGGSSDLNALRLIHPHILDTFILDKQFEPVDGGRSLKNLCDQRLGIKVQVTGGGRLGHDSVEDAMAARELAILYIQSLDDGENAKTAGAGEC